MLDQRHSKSKHALCRALLLTVPCRVLVLLSPPFSFSVTVSPARLSRLSPSTHSSQASAFSSVAAASYHTEYPHNDTIPVTEAEQAQSGRAVQQYIYPAGQAGCTIALGVVEHSSSASIPGRGPGRYGVEELRSCAAAAAAAHCSAPRRVRLPAPLSFYHSLALCPIFFM